MSHPAWVCGLKPFWTARGSHTPLSHPAWVCGLKLLCQTFQTSACVTPCVGVWIETRGLRELTAASVVTPCVGVWIETSILQQRVNLPLLSHPAWVCGLKQVNDSFKQCRNRSHTLRGCVDWNLIGRPGIQHGDVTPCVGVWIETHSGRGCMTSMRSHPAWVCGLKPEPASLIALLPESHPAWVCGLKRNIIVLE